MLATVPLEDIFLYEQVRAKVKTGDGKITLLPYKDGPLLLRREHLPQSGVDYPFHIAVFQGEDGQWELHGIYQVNSPRLLKKCLTKVSSLRLWQLTLSKTTARPELCPSSSLSGSDSLLVKSEPWSQRENPSSILIKFNVPPPSAFKSFSQLCMEISLPDPEPLTLDEIDEGCRLFGRMLFLLKLVQINYLAADEPYFLKTFLRLCYQYWGKIDPDKKKAIREFVSPLVAFHALPSAYGFNKTLQEEITQAFIRCETICFQFALDRIGLESLHQAVDQLSRLFKEWSYVPFETDMLLHGPAVNLLMATGRSNNRKELKYQNPGFASVPLQLATSSVLPYEFECDVSRKLFSATSFAYTMLENDPRFNDVRVSPTKRLAEVMKNLYSPSPEDLGHVQQALKEWPETDKHCQKSRPQSDFPSDVIRGQVPDIEDLVTVLPPCLKVPIEEARSDPTKHLVYRERLLLSTYVNNMGIQDMDEACNLLMGPDWGHRMKKEQELMTLLKDSTSTAPNNLSASCATLIAGSIHHMDMTSRVTCPYAHLPDPGRECAKNLGLADNVKITHPLMAVRRTIAKRKIKK